MSATPSRSSLDLPDLRPSSARWRAWARFLEESSFLRHYFRKYWGYVLAGLAALVLVDLLEILPPILLKESIDVVTENGSHVRLAQLAGMYLGVAFLQALGRYGWRMYLVRSSMFSGRDLRRSFSQHLFGLCASFFDRRPVGVLMSHATSDVESVRQALGPGLLTMADAIFYFLTVPVAMWILSPKLTLLAFLPMPIIPWLVMRNERLVHERYEQVQECFSELSAMAQESLNGIRVTKAFAKEDATFARFLAKGQEFVRLNLRLSRVQSAFGPNLDFVMSLGMVLLLYFGGRSMIENGDAALTLGTFVAFQRYIQKMVWPMAAIGLAMSTYQRSVTSAGRLKEVFLEETSVPEPQSPASLAPRSASAASVEFRNLCFRFPGTDRDVLRGISLRVEAGERVAFVGTIGSGKSALLSLLPRLYPVAAGALFVDGVDVNDWRVRDLRSRIGYVSQEVFLFSDTVLENIAYGLDDWNRGAGQVDWLHESARLAAVHDDLRGLHRGFETIVGERGVSLSGGQKQRLTIARALVKRPSVLVLDDALSAVDVQTEEKILKGLRARPDRGTELIAAHRISTIMDSDRIVVLEGGRVAQMGNHRELIAERDGIYRRFYDQQRLKDDLEQYSRRLDREVVGAPDEVRS